MASLVADYGSDSLSDTSLTSEENDESVADATISELTSTCHSPQLPKDECSNYFAGCDDEDQSPDDSPERVTVFRDDPNGSSTRKLPKPNFDRKPASAKLVTNSAVSVFANPFRAAEEEKTSVLERHVKMTPGGHYQGINGKQVCWNFRKGRCRFGHKCKFAHDSDFIASSKQNTAPTSSVQSEVDNLGDPDIAAEHTEGSDEVPTKRKKAGLSNSLVPSKRAMKAYRKQQQKEQPWLTPK